jgi:hypothetical protein
VKNDTVLDNSLPSFASIPTKILNFQVAVSAFDEKQRGSGDEKAFLLG